MTDAAGAERLEPVTDRAVRRIELWLCAQMPGGIATLYRRGDRTHIVSASVEARVRSDQNEENQRNGDRAAVHTPA